MTATTISKANKRDIRFINRAAQIAAKSSYRWTLGAVLVDNNRILGYAPNRFRNAPRINHHHATVHAEIGAIKNAIANLGFKGRYANLEHILNTEPYLFKGTTLYVARAGKNNDMRLAKPCKNCQPIIARANIDKVVYTTNDENGTLGVYYP